MNSIPKFVASRILEEPLGGNLLGCGCGELAYHLARDGLVDEIRFWVHLTVWGAGKRPFHTDEPVPLRLRSTTTFRSGVALLCYGPTPGR
jgi:dihydrofolate reductase